MTDSLDALGTFHSNDLDDSDILPARKPQIRRTLTVLDDETKKSLQVRRRASVAQTVELETFDAHDNDLEDGSHNHHPISQIIQQIEDTQFEIYSLRESLLQSTLDLNGIISNIHFPILLMNTFEQENAWDFRNKCSPLKTLSCEDLLLRWINFHIQSFYTKNSQSNANYNSQSSRKSKTEINNFGNDFVDGTNHWILLKQLKLADLSNSLFDSNKLNSNHFDNDRLIDTINNNKEPKIDETTLNDGIYIVKRDIVQANPMSTFVYLAQLMVKHPNITCEAKHLKQLFDSIDKLIQICDKCLQDSKKETEKTSDYSETIAHRYYRYYKDEMHKQNQQQLIDIEKMSNAANVFSLPQSQAQQKQPLSISNIGQIKTLTESAKSKKLIHQKMPEYFKNQRTKIRFMYEKIVSTLKQSKDIVDKDYQSISKQYKIYNLLHNEFNVLLQNCLLYTTKLLSLHRRGIYCIINDRKGLENMEYYSKIDEKTFIKEYIPRHGSSSDQESKRAILRKCEKQLINKIQATKSIFQTYSKRDTSDPEKIIQKMEGDDLEQFLLDIKTTLQPSLIAKYKTSNIVVTKDNFVTFLFELCWHTALAKYGNKITKSRNVYPFHKYFDQFMTQTVLSNAKESTDVENILGLPIIESTMNQFRDALYSNIFIKISTKDAMSGLYCLDVKQWKNFLYKYGLISGKVTEKDATGIYTSANSSNATQFAHLDDKLIYQQFEEALVVLALIKNSNPYIPMQYRIADMLQKIVDMMK